MIPKGLNDIKGLRSLNTRPGPINNTDSFLKLYQLSAEKGNLTKKLSWFDRQKNQTEKRISDVTYAIQALEARTHKELTSDTHARVDHPFFKY